GGGGAPRIRRARAPRRRLPALPRRGGGRPGAPASGREAGRVIDAPTPFFARAHRVVFGLAVASLLFGLVWGVVGEDFDYVATNGANGYSRSALGFQALAELLEARGVPVVRSRYHTGERVGPGDVVVVAAPDRATGDEHSKEIQAQLLGGGHRVLLVLPKWRPSPRDELTRDQKLGHVQRVDAARVS